MKAYFNSLPGCHTIESPCKAELYKGFFSVIYWKKSVLAVKLLKNKVFSLEEVLVRFHDGQCVLFGDMQGAMTAAEIIDGLVSKGVKNITAVALDSGQPGMGIGKLVENRQIRRILTSHIGLNPFSRELMLSGEMEVEFIPQGTFAERIRAGGYGLGGVLTPTGLGTSFAEGKPVINVDGRDFILEKPIRGDIALLKATKADKAGNLQFRLTSICCQDYMAMAAELVIVEVEELVEIGELKPDEIDVPGAVVDMLYVKRGEKRPLPLSWQRLKAETEGGAR